MPADPKNGLRNHLLFLNHSSAFYDRGAHVDALRIAISIRVLMHHKPRSSIALLNQPGATNISLLTTCRPLSGTFTYRNCMAVAGHPRLGSGSYQAFIRATNWWEQTVFATEGFQFSRKDIVLCAADQEAAHVDPQFRPNYEILLTPGSPGHRFTIQTGQFVSEPIANAHHIALRQMAYELLNSPELLVLGEPGNIAPV